MPADPCVVRRLGASDVDEADRVMRSAFGTYLGMEDPAGFGGDAELVRTRAAAGHVSAFVAELEGRIVGSSMLTWWGSFAFVGPVTVDASVWNGGLGRRLMEPVVDELDDSDVTFAGLFTFANSPKHIGLYNRFGFHPRALTALLERAVDEPMAQGHAGATLSARSATERVQVLADIGDLCSTVFDGLDLSGEIEAITAQGLGDVVLLGADRGLEAFAVCHVGAGSEAGGGTCYVKFAAVRPGPHSTMAFDALLGACEGFARERGATSVLAGVNTERQLAYERLLARGYRAGMYGVAMHRPNHVGFSRHQDFVLDDWR